MSSNVSLLIQTNSLPGARCGGWSRLPQRVQSMSAKRCGERASQRLVIEQTALLAEGGRYRVTLAGPRDRHRRGMSRIAVSAGSLEVEDFWFIARLHGYDWTKILFYST